MKKRIVYVIIAVLFIVGLAYLREYLSNKAAAEEAKDSPYAVGVESDHPLVQRFLTEYGQEDILLACSADVNADGVDDLIVIFSGEDANSTVAMMSDGDSYFYTDPTPAPRENQKIRFTNIDKGEDLEVMITGEKNGQVGYAVYKTIGHEFRNLYGENMKDCC